MILSIPVVVLAVLYKNAGIGLNNLLGFTGSTKLLYTTGEITPGLAMWSWEGIVDRLAHLGNRERDLQRQRLRRRVEAIEMRIVTKNAPVVDADAFEHAVAV